MTLQDNSALQRLVEALRALRALPEASKAAEVRPLLEAMAAAQQHLDLRSVRASSAMIMQSCAPWILQPDASPIIIRILQACAASARPLPLSFWPGALGLLASACMCRVLSESLRLHSLLALHVVVEGVSSDLDAVKTLREEVFKKSLAHIFAALLDLAVAEADRKLRHQALVTMLALANAAGRDAMRPIIPGLASGVARVAAEDFKVGSAVIVQALEAFSTLLALAFPHELDKTSPIQRLKDMASLAPGSVHKPQQQQQNADAGRVTASKLVETVVRRRTLSGLQASVRTRLALVQFAKDVIEKTSLLDDCNQTLTDTLMGLGEDEADQVREAALLALRSGSINSSLNANAMIDKVKNLGPAPSVQSLRRVLGYVRSLPAQQISLTWPPLVPTLLHLLQVQLSSVQALEMDSSVEIRSTANSAACPVNQAVFYSIRLDVLGNEKARDIMFDLCRALGRSIGLEAVSVIIPPLLSLQHASQRPESVLLSNLLLEGAVSSLPGVCASHAQRHERVLQCILDAYLDVIDDEHQVEFDHGQLPMSLAADIAQFEEEDARRHPDALTLSRRKEMKEALQLRGVASVANAMGSAFDSQLKHVLYSLLLKLASPSALISQNALAALGHCCRAANYTNFQQMVRANFDYLVDSISFKLRLPEESDPLALAPAMFEAMLEKTGFGHDLVPLLDDTVRILLEALDQHRSDDHVHAILKALLSIVRAFSLREASDRRAIDLNEMKGPILPSQARALVKKASSVLCSVESVPAASTKKVSYTPDQVACRLAAFVGEMRHQQQECERFEYDSDNLSNMEDTSSLDDGEAQGGDSQRLSDSEAQNELPLSASNQTVIAILERARHFLESPLPVRRHLVLDLITEGLFALRWCERALLPTVAQMWPPLLPRFVDSHPAIASKALESAEVMLQLCPQFINRRLSQELWPNLRPILCRERGLHGNPGLESGSITKLQLRGLQFLSKCLKDPTSSCTHALASNFIDTCWHFLASKNMQLANAAEILFEQLLILAPDTAWWKLVRLQAIAPGNIPSQTRYSVAPPQCLPVQRLRLLSATEQKVLAGCGLALDRLVDKAHQCSEPMLDDYLI